MGHLEDLKAIKLDLEAKIKAAETELKAEQDRRRATVRREWKFTFLPVKPNSWDEVWDENCVFFQLHGEVLNKEECLSAGHSGEHVHGGSMNYLVNQLNGRIVLRAGGGMLFLTGDGFWNTGKKQHLRDVLTKLEQFLAANPDGGDVTDIIVNQPEWAWGKS